MRYNKRYPSGLLLFTFMWFFLTNACSAERICELDGDSENQPKKFLVTLEETKAKILMFCLINRDTGKILVRIPSSYQMDPAEPEGDSFNISHASFSYTGWNADKRLFFISEGVHHGMGEVFLIAVPSASKAREIAFNTEEIEAKTTALLSQQGLKWERFHLGVSNAAWEGRKLPMSIVGRAYEKTKKDKGVYQEIRFRVIISIDAHNKEHLESVTRE